MIAGRLADHYPPGLLGGIGLVTLGLGMGGAGAARARMPPRWDICWRTALCGAGFGFFQAPNLKAIMSSVPARRSGSASGVIATARILGQTLGASLVALCFHVDEVLAPQAALWIGCAFALVGSVASMARLAPGARDAAPLPSRL